MKTKKEILDEKLDKIKELRKKFEKIKNGEIKDISQESEKDIPKNK